jgi:hypothetical protein
MRRRHRNPDGLVYGGGGGIVHDLTQSVKQAFSLDTVKTGGIMLSGAIVNSIVRDFIAAKLGIKPPFQYLLGLGTAGLLGMGANRIKAGIGNQVFMGAVTFEMARAYNEYIGSKLYKLATNGMGRGIGDFLIQPQVAGAVPSPMGDFLIQPQVAGAVPSPMGGFLDPYQRVPSPVGMPVYGDLASIGDELGADLGDAMGG